MAAAAEQLEKSLAPETVKAVVVSAPGTTLDPGEDLTVLDDAGGEIAATLGARPGEVFVVRPDGLVLCRTTDVAELSDLAAHVLAGTAPAGTAPEEAASSAPAAEQARENVWLALSEALDGAEESDREGFLTRLAMLLGDRVGPEVFADCASIAARVR
ncbi:hypothetical protein ACFSVJ_02670 [Prauserella oleivorans]